jgi:CRP/FNR family transcriptional regulator
MTSKERILADSVLFQGISEPLLHQLAAIAQEKQFNRGETVFLEGSPSSGFYVVAQGQVKIIKMALDGREQIIYALGAGEPFGLAPIFHGQHFPASAVCMIASTVYFFKKQDVIALIAAHPDLALAVIALLSLRLRRFATKIESLSLKEVPMRLATHLVYLAEEQGKSEQVTLDMPKKQLANLLGTSAETLSRIFAEMSAAGLIRVDGKKVALLCYEDLKRKSG